MPDMASIRNTNKITIVRLYQQTIIWSAVFSDNLLVWRIWIISIEFLRQVQYLIVKFVFCKTHNILSIETGEQMPSRCRSSLGHFYFTVESKPSLNSSLCHFYFTVLSEQSQDSLCDEGTYQIPYLYYTQFQSNIQRTNCKFFANPLIYERFSLIL